MNLNLYHLTQTEVRGYDTYSSAVVCACDHFDAACTHPDGGRIGPIDQDGWSRARNWPTDPAYVTARFLGVADGAVKRGVVCASYHAG